MNREILDLIDKKLSFALRNVDGQFTSEIRAQWARFSPAPNCPTAGAVQNEIEDICHRGYKERDKAAKAEIEYLLKNHGKDLNLRHVKEIVELIRKHFPLDVYVNLAGQTESVYLRANGPKNRLDKNSVSLKTSLIKARAANFSGQSIDELCQIIRDYELRARKERNHRWIKVLRPIGKYIVAPSIAWIFGIIGAIITGVAIFILTGHG
jgi:hypothetical protein